MSGKEVIPFSVKGPIPVQVGDSRGSSTGRIGCAIIDLNFQYPSQIGELIFSNYYTAWLSVYVKRISSKLHSFAKLNDNDQTGKQKARPHFERSYSTDFSEKFLNPTGNPNCGHKLNKRWLSQSSEEKEDLDFDQVLVKQSFTNDIFNTSPKRRHNSSGPFVGHDASTAERPWELSIECKTLMLSPHFEYGSQDIISIPATESMVEWRNVRVIRLVIYQPSTVWKRFSLEDINVFRDLPKRGFSHCDDLFRQRDNWFSILKKNAKAVLTGQLVEPENNTSDDEFSIHMIQLIPTIRW